MRRFRLIAWALIAVLLLDWAPLPTWLPDDISQAAAQTPAVTVIGPGGTLYYSTASVILSNVATPGGGQSIFSIVIPGSMFATQAAANTTSTMSVGQPTLGPLNSSIPLHLQIAGALDTASTPGTINVGVSFGQGTTTAGVSTPASIALANAYTPAGSIVAQPVLLDVWLSPIATGNMTNLAAAGNATPNITNTVFLHGQLVLYGGVAASGGVTNVGQLNTIIGAASIAAVNTASAHILNVLWGFGSAGPNYLRIFKVILRQGN